MKKAYQIEMLIAAIGILAIVVFLLPIETTMTGHIPEENAIHSQSVDLTTNESRNYVLTTVDGKNLHLSSFLLNGEVIGKGRVEILLDNGKQQFLVYENIKKQKGVRITGTTVEIEKTQETKEGIWLVIQPSKVINYEFLPLKEDKETIEGIFSNACAETCSIPEGLFNTSGYRLIFRLEEGTTANLYGISYTIH